MFAQVIDRIIESLFQSTFGQAAKRDPERILWETDKYIKIVVSNSLKHEMGLDKIDIYLCLKMLGIFLEVNRNNVRQHCMGAYIIRIIL